jgi:hypothetical protein
MRAKAVFCAAAGALALVAATSIAAPAQAHWDRGGSYAWRPEPWHPHWRPEPWRPHVWRHHAPPRPYQYQYGFDGPHGYWR